jgi:hypothetical protein
MYVSAIKAKCLPFLNDKIPICNELMTAEQLMTNPVITLPPKATVE